MHELLLSLKQNKKRPLSKEILNWIHDGPVSVSLSSFLNSNLGSEKDLRQALAALAYQELLILSQGGYISLTGEGHLASERHRPVVRKPLSPSGVPFPKESYTPPSYTKPARPNSEDFLFIRSLLTSDLLLN